MRDYSTYGEAYDAHLDESMYDTYSVKEIIEAFKNSSYEEELVKWFEVGWDFICIKCGAPVIEAHAIGHDDYILCLKCSHAMDEMIHKWLEEKNERKK